MRASQQFGNSGQYFSQCINGRYSMCPYPDRKSLGYSCHAHLHIRVRILHSEIKGTTFNKPFYPDLHIIWQDLGLKKQQLKYVECFHSYQIVRMLQLAKKIKSVILGLNVLSNQYFMFKCFFHA